jgi:hypothetical protein
MGDVEGEAVDHDVLTAVSAERLAVGNTWHSTFKHACVPPARQAAQDTLITAASAGNRAWPGGTLCEPLQVGRLERLSVGAEPPSLPGRLS